MASPMGSAAAPAAPGVFWYEEDYDNYCGICEQRFSSTDGTNGRVYHTITNPPRAVSTGVYRTTNDSQAVVKACAAHMRCLGRPPTCPRCHTDLSPRVVSQIIYKYERDHDEREKICFQGTNPGPRPPSPSGDDSSDDDKEPSGCLLS